MSPPSPLPLACRTVRHRETQEQMSAKVISRGHSKKTQQKKKGNGSSFLFCAEHSSSLAARAANTRCLRLVLHQLCLGSHHQHRGTYASIFLHLDLTVLHPSVGHDSAAASWAPSLPRHIRSYDFHVVFMFLTFGLDGHPSAAILKEDSSVYLPFY